MKHTTSRPYPDLLTWRRTEQLEQAEAAELIGMSRSNYSRLERGLIFVTRTRAKHVMDVTGVPLEKLMGVA